jgi:hypothetical protein
MAAIRHLAVGTSFEPTFTLIEVAGQLAERQGVATGAMNRLRGQNEKGPISRPAQETRFVAFDSWMKSTSVSVCRIQDHPVNQIRENLLLYPHALLR